ncbi:hypothetical protein [Burkholderia ubonensis]|nr:hypothetical protein [Burkholderia ubonensis]
MADYSNIDTALAVFEPTYRDLFSELRGAGWHEGRRADPAKVALEPHWPMPFPMHDMARDFLLRFSGVNLVGNDWAGVRFGCGYLCTADSLKVTAPYDVERLVLGEDEDTGRPPAFPIGTMDDWMLFLREDWTTLTVAFTWRHVLLTADPFQVVEEFRCSGHRIWDDPQRHICVDDINQVPVSLIGGAYDL